MIWSGSSHDVIDLQSEKRAAEYVIYSTALLLWLYIPRIFTESVTDRSEDQTLWLLSGVLSSVAFVLSECPLHCLSVPYVHPRAGSVYFLQLACKFSVMVLYDVTDICSIKPCKVQSKKRLTKYQFLYTNILWAEVFLIIFIIFIFFKCKTFSLLIFFE